MTVFIRNKSIFKEAGYETGNEARKERMGKIKKRIGSERN